MNGNGVGSHSSSGNISNHHSLHSSNQHQQHAASNGQAGTIRISRSSTRKKPFHFISSMWKMKKIIKFEDIMFHREMNCRARSEPSVSTYNCTSKGCQRKSSPSFSMLSLSPGKFQKPSDELEVTRLRLSRNDNPFVQKVLASRDNVTDVVDDTTESDDAILILMSDEFNGETETDPLALPQVHEHMIRSPPPTFWPRSQKTVFNFGSDERPRSDRTDGTPGSSQHRANQCNY
ncbi:uncharacterized protein LOC131291043 [Anopheles ziemanni]|uniref:uncharacterized protein LOC131269258 n=1 Tax=Anopheles coustani TaxID=139045 RepID=UPI0026595BE0|nr:uncharacterized protein LOC131269258 [Anopheles coustani]XP_058176215.1 uncharacterized protein LOC131291043 [Anopheles ziemanni]